MKSYSITGPDGAIRFYEEGGTFYHRETGPAIIYSNGSQLWYMHGDLHRLNGPAIDFVDGYSEWYLHGKLHRKDGPAVIHATGHKYWYFNNKNIKCNSQKEFIQLMNLKSFW